VAIATYALFTVTSGKNPSLVVTVPIVYYAIMHYKHLVLHRAVTEEPELVLVRDGRIILSIVVWLVACVAITYGGVHLFR
jgi:hypothetical protein